MGAEAKPKLQSRRRGKIFSVCPFSPIYLVFWNGSRPRQPPLAPHVPPLGVDPALSDDWRPVALWCGWPDCGDDPEAPHDADPSAGVVGGSTPVAILAVSRQME